VRKAASIFLAVLVLLTGLHLSIASHFCGGQLADVKISLTGKDASCGMEAESDSSFPSGKFIKTHCCTNDLTTLTVDSNYSPSFAKSIDVLQKVIHISGIPLTEIVKDLAFTHYSHPILSPPGIFRANTVELADICVFRI
jgi:hypothetical protein